MIQKSTLRELLLILALGNRYLEITHMRLDAYISIQTVNTATLVNSRVNHFKMN
jgi:hypothetical protein